MPFLVSFGIFPSLATLALPDPRVAAGWGWIAGAALGAAVHLTNVLPDLDDDERTGVRGLPHRIGPRASAVVAAVGIVAGAVAVLVGSSGGDARRACRRSAWVFFAAVVVGRGGDGGARARAAADPRAVPARDAGGAAARGAAGGDRRSRHGLTLGLGSSRADVGCQASRSKPIE